MPWPSPSVATLALDVAASAGVAPELDALVASLPDDAHVREQTLAFLGHTTQEVDDALARRIGDACLMVAADTRVRFAVRTLPSAEADFLFEGADITRHLEGATEVSLFVVTLGLGIDRRLRLLASCDPLGQVVYDAAASAAVERLADAVEAWLRARIRERGFHPSWRFSPGYGDLPLAVQPRLLAAVGASRLCGVQLTDSYLMVPTKSVTAIIGVHEEPQEGLASTCGICDLRRFCTLRRRGVTCGNRGDVSDLGSGERN